MQQYFCVDIRDRLDLSEAADLFGKEFARDQIGRVIRDLLEQNPRVRLSQDERERLVGEVLDVTKGLGPDDPE